jgi:2-iminoacetate synthase
LQKASEAKGLNLLETSMLLHVNDADLIDEIFSLAKKVKEMIYGNRIVLFIPLYISNECNNTCSYCAFRTDNKDLERITLSTVDIKSEVEEIQKQGHKRILAVFGESAKSNVHKMVESIETIYQTKTKPTGEIRRVNINSAPLTVDDFKILKTSQIGTYQCFQETYHKTTYENVHLAGTKKDYIWRLYALHRAQEAGIDDVATGVLYGLFDPYFDTLAMLRHATELEKVFGVGPHTVSFPRIEPAFGSEISINPPYKVDDNLFKKIIAVLRLSIPYTGMILSTRETSQLRKELIHLGISQISVGSKTSPGSYQEGDINNHHAEQFKVADERNLDEVIYELVKSDLVPSFCTACYRLGRHGDNFMDMAKNKHIKSFCQPNAMITFAEFLEDYASEKTKIAGYEMINRFLQQTGTKKHLINDLNSIKNGKRDVYY